MEGFQQRHRLAPIVITGLLCLVFCIRGLAADTAAIDAGKANLVLTQQLVESNAQTLRKRVSYPESSKPASFQNIYWVVENPGGSAQVTPMRSIGYLFAIPTDGTYRVSAEYRTPGTRRVLSNVLEIKVSAGELAAFKDGAKLPSPPPEVTDPATLTRLNVSEEWTGDITLAPGLYRLDHRIGIGTLKPDVAGHIVSG